MLTILKKFYSPVQSPVQGPVQSPVLVFHLAVFIVSIIVTAYALVQHFMSYVDGYVENVVISAFDDCDILDKAIYSTGNVNNYSMVTIKARKDMRSRNAKYVYYNNYCRVRLCKQRYPS